MKHFPAIALLLFCVHGSYAKTEQTPVRMTFSGSMVPTSINMGPNTVTDEELLAGDGTFGPFTFRKLRTDALPAPSSACSGPMQINVPVVAAASAGVFRFQDGSLLTIAVTEGALCIDLALVPPAAHLSETYRITGGTGRFRNAAAICGAAPQECTLKSTGTLGVVLFDAAGSAKLLSITGNLEGTLSRLAIREDEHDERR
jgi:hypothetical protein